MSSNLVKTSSEWNSSSLKAYIPPRGVLCVEISNEVSNDDQNINHNISIKVGDGERAYPALPYLSFKDEYIEDIRIRLIKMINEQSDKIVDAYTKDEIDSLLKEIDDKINGIDTTVDLSEYVKKTDIPEIPETHTHDNKSILDQIECVFTPQEKEKLANLNINDQGQTVNDHTHSNKSILDKIEVAMTKDDREKLNQLTKGRNYDTEISELKSNTHSHAHLDILEGTTASFTTEYEEIIKNWKPSESATYESFKGATDSDDGETGLVPAPLKGDQDKFLRGDGTWVTVEVSGSGESFTLVAGDNVTIVDDDENKTKTISVTIPSVDLSGYATTSYVDNKVSNIVIPPFVETEYIEGTDIEIVDNGNGTKTINYVGEDRDTIYTSGDGIHISEDGVISVNIPDVSSDQISYKAGTGIAIRDSSNLFDEELFLSWFDPSHLDTSEPGVIHGIGTSNAYSSDCFQWDLSVNSGVSSARMSNEQRHLPNEDNMQIAGELGHTYRLSFDYKEHATVDGFRCDVEFILIYSDGSFDYVPTPTKNDHSLNDIWLHIDFDSNPEKVLVGLAVLWYYHGDAWWKNITLTDITNADNRELFIENQGVLSITQSEENSNELIVTYVNKEDVITINVVDTGWVSASINNGNISSSNIEYRKIATGLVEICGTFTPMISTSFNTLTLFTLPEEYRPHKKRKFIQLHPNILTPFLLTVDMDGVVKIDSPSSITFDDDQEYYIEAMYLAGSVTI